MVGGTIYLGARYLGNQTLHVAKKQWYPAKAADQGVDPHRLRRAEEYIDARLPSARGLIIIKNGKTILEKYYWKGGPEETDFLHSLNGCVIEALIGIALQEGLITRSDQPLSDFFPDYYRQGSGRDISRLTIDDLLRVHPPLIWGNETTEYWQLFYAKDQIVTAIGVLASGNMEPNPAAKFAANFLLAKIIEKVSAVDIFEFANSRLFAPMGITTYSERKDNEEPDSDFIGFKLKTLDLAKFGYLILNQGDWQGSQIVPQTWIQKKMKVVSIDPLTDNRGSWQSVMIDGVKSYIGRGEGGQFIVFSPELDLVIAVSSKSWFPLFESSSYPSLFQLIVRAAKADPSTEQSPDYSDKQGTEQYFAPNFVFATKVPEDIQQFFSDFAKSIATNDVRRVAHHYVKGYYRVDNRYIYNRKVSVYEFWGKIFNGGSGELQSVQINKIRIDKNRAYLRGVLKYSYHNMNEGSVGWFPLENLMKIRDRWQWVGVPASAAILDRDEYFDVEISPEVSSFLNDCSGAFIGPEQESRKGCFSKLFLHNGITQAQLSERLKPFFQNHKAKLHFTRMDRFKEGRTVEGYFDQSIIGSLSLPPTMKITKENDQWKWLGNGRK